jgi:hypothetical protein
MKVRRSLWTFVLATTFGIAVVAAPARLQAQDAQGHKEGHVVSPEELTRDAAKPLETRQANEAAVRHLLSSAPGQEALRSAHVDYQKIDKAIGQLNDEELAKLADRSRQAESDFAAGFISPKHLAELILVIVVVVVIIVLV